MSNSCRSILGKCLLIQLTPSATRDFYRLSVTHQGRTAGDDGQRRYGGRATVGRRITNGVIYVFVEMPETELPALVEQFEKEFGRDAARTRAERMMRGTRRVAVLVVHAGAGAQRRRGAERLQLVWPTPSTAWADGKSPAQWLQHAGSGDPDSGGFGGVRSAGGQFHEGIDIKPVTRDRRGEPLDSVFAAMPGVVRYVSTAAGDSSYGRYVVLEHPAMTPAVYTLYAHLARIAPELRPGVEVTRRTSARNDGTQFGRLHDSHGPLASAFRNRRRDDAQFSERGTIDGDSAAGTSTGCGMA